MNLRKRKNVECTRNIDLETLIAEESWATIEEMELVIPFHLHRYRQTIKKCCGDGIITKAANYLGNAVIPIRRLLNEKQEEENVDVLMDPYQQTEESTDQND